MSVYEFEVPDLVQMWIDKENAYSRQKFGKIQTDRLVATGLMNEGNFGGQAGLYWSRMHNYDDTAPMHRAQYALKTANATQKLWASIRAIDWQDNRFAVRLASELVHDHLVDPGYTEAKRYIDRSVFYETPVGLGLAYLAKDVAARGFDRKFRLGFLRSAQQIMEDAGSVAALQCERTIEAVGMLPAPELSSGNIEPWEI